MSNSYAIFKRIGGGKATHALIPCIINGLIYFLMSTGIFLILELIIDPKPYETKIYMLSTISNKICRQLWTRSK
jgi:hypothetical protein